MYKRQVLDDAVRSCIRTVTSGKVVTFHVIEIISDEADGIWVSGLPDIVDLIVVGQQSVIPGEVVNSRHLSPRQQPPLSASDINP